MRNRDRLSRLKHLSFMLKHHDQIFPEVAFSIFVWVNNGIVMPHCILGERSFHSSKEYVKAKDCGTVACALGSACFYKPFKKLGLKKDSSFDMPKYEGEIGFDAGKKFFGLNERETFRLFDGEHYNGHNPSPKQVATRVDRLINKYSTTIKKKAK